MLRLDNPISRHLLIVAAFLAVTPGVILAQQQEKLGVALPPPSLYDDAAGARLPRSGAQSVPTTAAPTTTRPPAAQPQSQPSAATNPAPTTSGSSTRAPTTAPAGASASKAQPKPEPVEVKPLQAQPAKEERALEPEPAPATAAEPASMPPPKETVTLAADALFSLGSAAIKTSARESLDAFVKKVKGMEFESIKIIGHTDPTGPPHQNINLSLARAEAVKRYLVAKGVDAKKIQTEGVGGSMPIVTDKDCSKLAREAKIVCLEPDRRVEIEVIKTMPKTAENK